MSMERCTRCDALVDTDYNVEGKYIGTLYACERCFAEHYIPSDSVAAGELDGMIALSDGLEVSPCIRDGYSCERVEDSTDADIWSVYLHLKAGGVEWIADFEVDDLGREGAEAAAMSWAEFLLEGSANLATYGINCSNSPSNKH